MQSAILLIGLLVVAGCAAEGVPMKEQSVPGGATVVKLAEIESCTIFRVRDGNMTSFYVAVGPDCAIGVGQ